MTNGTPANGIWDVDDGAGSRNWKFDWAVTFFQLRELLPDNFGNGFGRVDSTEGDNYSRESW